MKTLKTFLLAIFLFTTISFAQGEYTSSYTGGQIDNGVRPYKVYTALLSQTGTNAPVATVLENTLGVAVTWAREDVGSYSATATNAFTVNKTVCIVGVLNSDNATFGYIFIAPYYPDEVWLMKYSDLEGTTFADGIGSDLFVEIRVYP